VDTLAVGSGQKMVRNWDDIETVRRYDGQAVVVRGVKERASMSSVSVSCVMICAVERCRLISSVAREG
jgi:hypothetical protein